MCGSRKLCQRGSNSENVFFCVDEGRLDQYSIKAGHHRPPSFTDGSMIKRHFADGPMMAQH